MNYRNRIACELFLTFTYFVDAAAITVITHGHLVWPYFFKMYLIIAPWLFGIIFAAAFGWPIWWATALIILNWIFFPFMFINYSKINK